MKGKDLKEGMILGNKRVLKIMVRRGGFIIFTYEYLVRDSRTDKVSWHRQPIPPLDRIHVNAKLPDPSPAVKEIR